MNTRIVPWLGVAAIAGWPGHGRGDSLEDVGFRALAAELGTALPDGATVRIDQVEAPTGGGEQDPIYRADPAHAGFSGVTFHDQTGGPNPLFSGHATGVALVFAGTSSMTPGVGDVDSYEVNDWLGAVLYGEGIGLQRPVIGTGTLANHSWVGSTTDAGQTVDLLQRLDWLIDTDDTLQVVGVTTATNPLFSHAYNVLGVTRTTVTVSALTAPLDAFYAANRPLAHVVAPRATPSEATAMVTAAAALLRDAAPGDSLPPEALKALLMAGADRVTRNTATGNLAAPIALTANGLDPRYGAGQVNVLNSHRLLAGGEIDSVEDGGTQPRDSGYDHDPAFGGAHGANPEAHYPLGVITRGGRLYATLAWHATITDSDGVFAPTGPADRVVHDLNLELVQVIPGGTTTLAASQSPSDNTETLSANLRAGDTYTLIVSLEGAPITRDYALAWRLEADTDGDGLFDRFETGTCPAALDADTDDDGLADGAEDTDLDGVLDDAETDPCDADTDQDGIPDGVERGLTAGVPDPDGAGPSVGTDTAVFMPDADPGSVTDPRQADTDGDGHLDGVEDLDRNGALDPGESDPVDADSVPGTPVIVPALPPVAAGLLVLMLTLAAWRLRVT